MNLGVSSAVSPILKKLKLFIQEVVIPQEDNYNAQLSMNRWQVPAVAVGRLPTRRTLAGHRSRLMPGTRTPRLPKTPPL